MVRILLIVSAVIMNHNESLYSRFTLTQPKVDISYHESCAGFAASFHNRMKLNPGTCFGKVAACVTASARAGDLFAGGERARVHPFMQQMLIPA